MIEDQHDERRTYRLAKNKLVVLIIGATATSFVLVLVAMSIYWMSGAAQVDLSRPGFSAVREQAANNETDRPFESNGEITDKVLDDFEKRYKEKSQRVLDARVFNPSVMSDKTLRIPES